jgi:nucleosome binding factor SPN SPT16 subunit
MNVRETEKRESANLIAQEKLVLSKGRNPRLADVFVRPNPVGRRSNGVLESHTNGFRFSMNKGESIDILYHNIKQAFFQPAEKELIILVHFHLHNPIMVGKKKTQDVQFCTEVMEVSQALDGRRYDADELEGNYLLPIITY